MGFDNECILNIQSLAGEYFCPVCRLLVYPNEALQSQCTHLYCKPCLTYVVSTTRACPYDGYLVTTADSKPLIESNKALAETIGKIVVHCLYHRSGCTWQGPLTDCITHCSGCAFGNSPVVCNRCGIQIVHRQVQEHAQNCPGVQPQVQQVGTTQDNSTNATASAVDQNQPATQSAPETSQVQASQSTAILTAPGQVSNQPINSSSQGQALTQSTTLTPEQWYQQQHQQYQQYYQQYPGYDPYQQQYQQYYPYQQPASIQPLPSNLSSQHQTQGLMQPQPQTQTQPLPQVQVQPQSQLPPPPPLYMVHGQSQSTTESQTSMTTAPQTHVQFNTQQQLYPSGNAQSQIPPQIHPSSLNHSHPQPPSYPQAHPHPQQSAQTLHYQQSHPHAQNQQGQIQQPAYPQLQPQQHSVSQPQSQHHTLPQTQIAQHNQPMNINMQPQMQNPPAHAVTGHHSYPPPQPHQQLHTGVPQPTIQTPSQTGSLLQPHPTQMQDHLPQQPPMMRPMQSHVTYPNQQHPPSMLSPGQAQNLSHVPQLPTPVHAQHSGHTGNQRPTMNSVHQQTPQQQIQQKQHFVQHGQCLPQQVPIASHLGSQGPPHSLAQHNHGYLHPNTTMSNKMQQNQSQNLAGRPMGVSHGVQSLSHPQSMTVSHLRQIQTRENISSTNQSHDYRNNNRVQLGEQLSLDSARRTMIDGPAEHKDTADKEGKPTSQKAAQTVVNDSDMKPVIRGDVVELKSVKSEAEANLVDQKYSLTGNKSANVALGSELLDGGSGKPLTKETEVKTDVKESAFDHSNVDKSGDGVTKDPKEIYGVDSKQMQQSDSENKEIDESSLNNPSSRDANYAEQIGMPIMTTSAGGRGSLKTTPNASASYVDSPHSEKRKLAHHDGFHEKGQVHASGFVQSFHLVPVVDQGKHQPQPNNFRPSTPPMLPAPPSGQLYPQAPANPPMQYSLQAPGYPGYAAYTSEHYLQSAIPDPGSAASFGRRPGNYTSPHQGEAQFQGLDQGLPSHGASNMPVGGSSGGQGGHDLPGHVGARAPLHTSEGQLGLPHPHPIHHSGNEMIPNLRPEGGRPVSAEQGPPHLAAMHMRVNAAPGFESSLTPDEKFKLMGTERLKSFSLDTARGEFQDDFKQLNRLSHLDTEPFQNYGAHPLRNLDRGIHGPNHDSDLQLDSLGGGGGASRFFPPHNLESGFHPSHERRDITGRTDLSHSHRDFFGSGLGYPRHHVDGLGPRSTFQDYHRINSRGFGGRPGISSFDEIDGRELRRFGDPFGNSLPESRFPFSSRSEFDGPGNFSVGEHLRSGDFIGRDRHFGHLRLGERSGFGVHPGHGLMGELDGLGSFEAFGSGNRQSHLRPGEPGFRSSFSLQGFPDDSRIYSGDKEAFGSWRKRRSLSMGWCRICKVDCETVEGLDLHSQTREHQKMAMDMVQSIKQSAKKQKLSASENPLSEDADRPTNGDLEGQGKSIK